MNQRKLLERVLVAKIAMAAGLTPVGLIFITHGDVALGIAHLIVLPFIAASAWLRLKKLDRSTP